MGTPNTIDLPLNVIGGRAQGSYPAINPDNSWRIAEPFRLLRVDTMRQVTHLPESGSYAAWRLASTKHQNVKRVAWRGGSPPFRFSVFLDGVLVQETVWVRTQSAVNPAMYDHSYPVSGYDHVFQPSISENGTTLNYVYLVESQDGQALVINAPTQVDDSRFKYFAPSASGGNNANAGTFEAPLETFGYGYASVANANTFIYCYKAGTYSVNNGTPNNNAAFDSTHCKSHIGIESGVVFDVSTGHFSGGTSDIYISNCTVTGGRASQSDVRQFDLSNPCARLHVHNVIGDHTVTGTVGNDNPACFMLWNVGPSWHTDIAFTDCRLTDASTSQFVVLFNCDGWLIENFTSTGANASSPNGAQHLHPKSGCKNGTIRHSSIVGQAANSGLVGVPSQDWNLCQNVDIHFCRIINQKSGGSAVVSRWNGQVDAIGEEMPVDYYIQRCDVDAYQSSPFTFENYEEQGYPVSYTGIRWESSSATFNNAVDAGGGVSFGTTTVKVADINTYSVDDLGVRGYKISSTLVS